MSTSNGSSYTLAWRISRYLALRLVVRMFKLARWLLARSFEFVVGVLALVASPASSGRSQDEFKDLVQSDAPEHDALRPAHSDGFWRMYLQAYSPRLWRMRRLLPMSVGKGLKDDQPDEDR